jgi:hypothetical protein
VDIAYCILSVRSPLLHLTAFFDIGLLTVLIALASSPLSLDNPASSKGSGITHLSNPVARPIDNLRIDTDWIMSNGGQWASHAQASTFNVSTSTLNMLVSIAVSDTPFWNDQHDKLRHF